MLKVMNKPKKNRFCQAGFFYIALINSDPYLSENLSYEKRAILRRIKGI